MHHNQITKFSTSILPKSKLFQRITHSCHLVIGISAFCLLLLSIGGFFPHIDWRLGWYSHPRPHFLLASLMAAVWFGFTKKWLHTLIPITCIIINGFVLFPFFSSQNEYTPQTESTLSILHLNTNKGLADLSAVGTFHADIVFLQEATPELMTKLEASLPNYRIAFSHPLSNTHGSALLVRTDADLDILAPQVHHLPETNARPLISAQTHLDDIPIRLLSFHAIRPHHPHADSYQQIEYDAVADWAAERIEAEEELIMIGDFNATPWSVRFKRFLDRSQTKDSMLGYGLQNSWVPSLPLWVGLPIDHAAISDGFIVIDRQTAPVENSDHGLLYLQIALTGS